MLLTSCGIEEIENRELSYMTQLYYKDVTIYIYSLSTLVCYYYYTHKLYIYSRLIYNFFPHNNYEIMFF